MARRSRSMRSKANPRWTRPMRWGGIVTDSIAPFSLMIALCGRIRSWPMRCAEVTGVLQQKRVFHRIACRFSGTKKEKALSQCQKHGTGLWCEPVCRDGLCFVLRWCGDIKVGCRLHLKTVHCSARFRNHTLIGTILCVRHNFSLLLFDLCFGVLLIV